MTRSPKSAAPAVVTPAPSTALVAPAKPRRAPFAAWQTAFYRGALADLAPAAETLEPKALRRQWQKSEDPRAAASAFVAGLGRVERMVPDLPPPPEPLPPQDAEMAPGLGCPPDLANPLPERQDNPVPVSHVDTAYARWHEEASRHAGHRMDHGPARAAWRKGLSPAEYAMESRRSRTPRDGVEGARAENPRRPRRTYNEGWNAAIRLNSRAVDDGRFSPPLTPGSNSPAWRFFRFDALETGPGSSERDQAEQFAAGFNEALRDIEDDWASARRHPQHGTSEGRMSRGERERIGNPRAYISRPRDDEGRFRPLREGPLREPSRGEGPWMPEPRGEHGRFRATNPRQPSVLEGTLYEEGLEEGRFLYETNGQAFDGDLPAYVLEELTLDRPLLTSRDRQALEEGIRDGYFGSWPRRRRSNPVKGLPQDENPRPGSAHDGRERSRTSNPLPRGGRPHLTPLGVDDAGVPLYRYTPRG